MKNLSLTILMTVLTLASVFAQDGKKMSFQGSLFQADQPFNGTVSLEFNITMPDGSKWTETQADVSVINGLYSVVLGSITPLPANLFYTAKEQVLSVSVDGVSLGTVTLYAPFATGDMPILPLDMPGANGKRSVMLSSEGPEGNDGTLRLADMNGASRVTLFANRYITNTDSTGTQNRVYTGAGGAYLAGANGTMGVNMSSDGAANSNGYMELGDATGTPRLRTYIWENNNGFARGEISLTNNRDTDRAILRSDQLYFFSGNDQYPAGWFGTIGGNSGFSQLVGYDETSAVTGAILTGFWDGNRPGFWIEDANAKMMAWLRMDENNTGRFDLQGLNSENIQMGAKAWEPNAGQDLPYFKMVGFDEVEFLDDKGTPNDTTDDVISSGRPELVWMEVQKWEDGTEHGAITLRGTDGSEFFMNSHGVGDMSNLNLKNLTMKDDQGRTAVQLNARPAGGGILRLPTADGKTFTWIQNSISGDGTSYGSTQLAHIAADGSYVSAAGMSPGYIYLDKMVDGQFVVPFETGLTQNTQVPFMHFKGNTQAAWYDDKGTPNDSTDDTSGTYYPDLYSASVDIWDDGSEHGSITLRGTDGSSFHINSYGIQRQNNVEAYRYFVKNADDEERIKIDEWGVNLKGVDTEVNAILSQNWLDGGESNLNRGALFLFGDIATRDMTGADIRRVDLRVKDDGFGKDLGQLTLRGPWGGDNRMADLGGYASDSTSYVGQLTLRGSDGSEFNINSYGLVGPYPSTFQVGKPENGTYTQHQSAAFRIKNDADQFSSVFLNRGADGSSRLQLASHADGTATATTFLGANAAGPYMFMQALKADGSAMSTLTDLYTTNADPQGNTYSNNYRRAGVDFYDNEGSRLSAIGSRRDEQNADPYGASGLVFLWAKDGVPNVEMSGKTWENSKLPILQLFGSTKTADSSWYVANAKLQVNSDGTNEWGHFAIVKSEIATGASTDMIAMDGNTGDMSLAGTLYQSSDARLKKDINQIQGALNNTLKMRGVTYTWKDETKSQKTQVGVIAQEVEQIYPELVNTDEKGMKSVNYAQMTAVLIEAVKELNAKISQLESENSDLKAQLDNTQNLEERLAQIEKILGVKLSETSSASNK